MRWEDERYVRVYTRDTVDWLALSFHAKALWLMLLRKADRAGIIHLGKRGRAAIAVLMGHPEHGESLAAALEELLADGCCEVSPDGAQLVIPNFIEAQEATKSPNERQREYRLRARDAARAGLPPASQKGCSIYFIQSEHGGPVKIGRAEDLAKRLVGLQTGRPDKLIVIAAAPGTRENESTMHRLLAPWRERGEWFSPSAPVMAAASLVNERGADAWAEMGDVIRHASGDETSPRTSPVASPVTPSRAVPSLAVPSSSLSAPADEPDDLPDATADAEPVTQSPLFAVEAPPNKPRERPEDLQALWNSEAHTSLPRWKELTDKRRRQATTRLRERPLAEWREVIRRINASPFLRGEQGTWRASPDWLLQPDAAVKVLEGKYTNPNDAAATTPRVGGSPVVRLAVAAAAPTPNPDKPRL